jgi:phospholipid/cholesterol/gamma-HCH transport system substrate-binding protein
VATATPPRPPLEGGSPPPPGQPSGAPRPAGASPGSARWVAAGALALAVLIVAFILFAGGGGATYQLVFTNASQLVLGDQVQVGGQPVGSVTGITLTHSGKARVTIHVNSSLTPLHEGTTAQIRVPSLTTVAGRYISLAPGPNNRPTLPSGAMLSGRAVQGTTDLDQLLDTFNPRTRKGLQQLFEGSAEQYAGVAEEVAKATEYFSPSVIATNHIFAELTRDQPTFSNFLVQASKAVTTLAAHSTQLTSLIGNSDQSFQALGSEQGELERGVRQLPQTLQQGNQAFAELPSTFAALRKLVNVSKPDTKTLARFFERLQPLVNAAGPVLENLSVAISKPGSNNDLTDAALALPALAKALASGSPNDIKALEESVPVTAFFGPYAPDLEGAVRDFGTSAGYYDADGNYARGTPVSANFKANAEGTELTPTTPTQGLEGLKLRELRRCPGSAATPPPADGSAPFTDEGLLGCDPSEVP